MEIEKNDLKEFLCSKLGIDTQIIGSLNPLPGAIDAIPGSGIMGSDVESPRIRRARINSIPEIEVSDTSSPRNKNVLMRMLAQLTPRSGSRISVVSMQSSTESLDKNSRILSRHSSLRRRNHSLFHVLKIMILVILYN